MTERLIIRNFAGLEDIDIELGRINIFIGPQASGKSVCAKLLYWFKSFPEELMKAAGTGRTNGEFDIIFLNRFKEYFPTLWRTKEHFVLRYEVGDFFIHLGVVRSRLHLSYSPFFQKTATTLRSTVRKIGERYAQFPRMHGNTFDVEKYIDEQEATSNMRSQLWKHLGGQSTANQSFILAGRAFFSLLKGAVLSFLASTTINDPFLRDFIKLYENSRRVQLDLDVSKSLALLVQSVLKGEMDVAGDEDFIVSANGVRVALANASSGQQESFPLIMILLALLWYSDYPGQIPDAETIYIEEPEAHLYPDSQRAIVQLMAGIFNTSGRLLQYVITTHSPYLLAAFNNLIYAHELAERFKDQPDKLKALYKVVPKNQQVGIENFRVYRLKGGKATPIISKNNLIVAEELDEVSEKMSQQFDRLMDLEQPLHETPR